MKVTLFYYYKELYAFSTFPRFISEFKKVRNMEKFYIKKIHMDEYEFSAFVATNDSKKLVEFFLYDGKTDLPIIGTIEESIYMERVCDEILEQNEYVIDCIKDLKCFTPKVEKILIKAATLTRKVKKNNHGGIEYDFEVEINTFDLFLDLFSDTFSV